MKMMSVIALSSAIAAISTGVQAGDQQREIEANRLALSQAQPAAVLANSCGSAPLPLTPVGPTVSATWYTGVQNANAVNVTGWRIPCGPTESMVVLTLTPTMAEPYLCTLRFTLLQSGGLIASSSNFWFNPDPGTINSFCGELLAPITVAFDPRSSMPANFDMDQAMTIVFDGGIGSVGTQELALFAFDPSQYNLTPPPGPHTVEVHVRGTGIQYRNCTVTESSQGGGTQYTASCDEETPQTIRHFERFDH